jgi:hypothetical protein
MAVAGQARVDEAGRQRAKPPTPLRDRGLPSSTRTADGRHGPAPQRKGGKAQSQDNQQKPAKGLGGDVLDRTVRVSALGCPAHRNLGRDRRDDQVGESTSCETSAGHGFHGTDVAGAARHRGW